MTIQAETAKAIRNELAEKFPSTTFKVSARSFAGGNSVDVRWFDGATYEDVNAIVKKYEYGSFDGMTDCYNIDNSRNDIPQVKYVLPQREISAETFENIANKLCSDYGVAPLELKKSERYTSFKDHNAVISGQYAHDLVYREFTKTSY